MLAFTVEGSFPAQRTCKKGWVCLPHGEAAARTIETGSAKEDIDWIQDDRQRDRERESSLRGTALFERKRNGWTYGRMN